MVAEDVFQALSELDFEKYEEPLRDFLRNYNAEKEDQARRIAAQKKSSMIVDTANEPEAAAAQEGD